MRRPAQAFYQKLLMLSGYAITINAHYRCHAASNHLSRLDEVGDPLVNQLLQHDLLAIRRPHLLLVQKVYAEGRHRVAAWPSCPWRIACGLLAFPRQPFRHLGLAACSWQPSILEGNVSAVSRRLRGQGGNFHGVAANIRGGSGSWVRSWNPCLSQQLRNIVHARQCMHRTYPASGCHRTSGLDPSVLSKGRGVAGGVGTSGRPPVWSGGEQATTEYTSEAEHEVCEKTRIA